MTSALHKDETESGGECGQIDCSVVDTVGDTDGNNANMESGHVSCL